ncbi:MAG: hypothetical protein PHO91_03775 [Patescibacteria group bacterium]|nr:hypothetical protein [Patescibacteria group bacterium]
MLKKIIVVVSIIIFSLAAYYGGQALYWYIKTAPERALEKAQTQAVEEFLQSRRDQATASSQSDPFDQQGKVRILFLGLDQRLGEDRAGHCDAIQFIEVDKDIGQVMITAVPRGTYSPLPPGKGATSSDYYISNACDLGGLEYGVKQIERILGKKADYLAVVGFSQTLGILRHLQLPAIDTLRWLRHRQSYAVGEPQRAHNHSTFIKQMALKYLGDDVSKIDLAWQYLLYKKVQTDLSFDQVKMIVQAILSMDLAQNPDKIKLSMQPPYAVEEIVYDEENLSAYLESRINPIKHLLSSADYQGLEKEAVQEKLLANIDSQKDNPEFISWAYDNFLWLQIEDEASRYQAQYDIIVAYLASVSETSDRQAIIGDYILEMEYYNQAEWAQIGRELLLLELGY